MRILVTGATGFVGRALCLRLERDRHKVVALVRSPARALSVLAASVELLQMPRAGEASEDELVRQLSSCDAILHLAGEPVLGKRWTDKQRKALHDSRVGLANRLVAAMAKASPRPSVFVSASAVGYYGDRGDAKLGEDAPAGDDFLAQLCVDWERAAETARAHGARVVCLRSGIVLGPEGGVLGVMETPFRLGLGGRLGSGRQFVPWIQLDDLLEMYARAIVDPQMSGAYNATAPEPVTNAEFTRAIGETLGRPTMFPVPKFALHALLGESASAPLASQRAIPKRFLELGFTFAHTSVRSAVQASLGVDTGIDIGPAHDVPIHDYLAKRKPTHLLEQTTSMQAPLEDVAPFFSDAENLGALTPPSITFSIESPRPIVLRAGTRIEYRIRVGGIPLRWLTVIEIWNGPAGFSDSQHRGPYRCFWHEHRFESENGGTRMRDRVFFSAPLGWLGRPAVRALVAPKLRRIFQYRAHAIAWRFGLRTPTI